VGHPLRKDFPLSGYKEIFFSEVLNKVVYRPVVLKQEYRFYEYLKT
jgi:NADH-quinone oxidoreductase subunit C